MGVLGRVADRDESDLRAGEVSESKLYGGDSALFTVMILNFSFPPCW